MKQQVKVIVLEKKKIQPGNFLITSRI